MEPDDLKSGWQNAGGAFKSEASLHRMIKVTNHPSLKKIRTKLIVESIGLVLFLFIYFDWFDGDKKPLYANIVLVVGLLLYISNDVIGYISITRPIMETNLKLSIQKYLMKIKRLSVFSLVISFLYSISIIIFFTSTINFTKEKVLILAGIIIVLFQLMFLSYRIWYKWINNLKQQVKDFNLDEEK
jgi:hypothetical protein